MWDWQRLKPSAFASVEEPSGGAQRDGGNKLIPILFLKDFFPVSLLYSITPFSWGLSFFSLFFLRISLSEKERNGQERDPERSARRRLVCKRGGSSRLRASAVRLLRGGDPGADRTALRFSPRVNDWVFWGGGERKQLDMISRRLWESSGVVLTES